MSSGIENRLEAEVPPGLSFFQATGTAREATSVVVLTGKSALKAIGTRSLVTIVLPPVTMV
jgi:hypothetical protein